MSQGQNQSNIDSYIPDKFGSKEVLLDNAPIVGRVDFLDGIIAFSPGIIFLLIGDAFLPAFLEPFSIFIAAILVILGSMLLIFKPGYMTISEWFSVRWDFRKRENELTKNYTDSDGSPFESYSTVPDDDTRQLTEVESVHPEYDVIELSDESMVGMLEFSGSNLDMASGEIVHNVVNSYKKTISTQLETDIQFYLPMRPVSMKETVERYAERIEDKQGQSSETISDSFMKEYLQDRANWVSSLGENSFVRELYVVVKIEKHEVYKDQVTGSSSLTELPGGETLENIRLNMKGQSSMESDAEIKRKQMRELQERLGKVGSTLCSGSENSFKIVSSTKMTALLKEFWEGDKILDDEMDALSKDYPFVTEPDELMKNQGGDV